MRKPRRQWTKADRDLVERLVARNESRTSIAAALGTSVSTLRRNFPEQLKPRKRGPVVPEYDSQVRRMVEALAGLGMKYDVIAEMMEISPGQLARHFARELATAKDRLDTNVINALYKNATTGMVPSAQIFWVKARCGWRDRTVVEVEEPAARGDAQSLEEELELLYRQMSPAEQEAWKTALAAIQRVDQESKAAAVTEAAADGQPLH